MIKERLKSILRNIMLIVVGLTAVMIMAELILRISGYQKPRYSNVLKLLTDMDREYELIPNTQGRHVRAPVKINSQGLRDKEYPLKKGKGTFRIISMGSCVTFGHGLELEKTYNKKLERMLNEMTPFGRIKHFEVINAGMPRLDMERKIKFLEEEAGKYNPDLIIFLWEIVDRKWWEIRRKRPALLNFIVYQIAPRMPRELDLTWLIYEKAKFYKKEFYWHEILKERGSEIKHLNKKYAASNPAWQKERQQLEKIFHLARKQKIPLLVGIFPWMNYLEEGSPIEHIFSSMADLCSANDVPSLNLFDSYKGEDPQKLWFNFRDRHPNEYAHQILTQALYKKLLAGNFLEDTSD